MGRDPRLRHWDVGGVYNGVNVLKAIDSHGVLVGGYPSVPVSYRGFYHNVRPPVRRDHYEKIVMDCFTLKRVDLPLNRVDRLHVEESYNFYSLFFETWLHNFRHGLGRIGTWVRCDERQPNLLSNFSGPEIIIDKESGFVRRRRAFVRNTGYSHNQVSLLKPLKGIPDLSRLCTARVKVERALFQTGNGVRVWNTTG